MRRCPRWLADIHIREKWSRHFKQQQKICYEHLRLPIAKLKCILCGAISEIINLSSPHQRAVILNQCTFERNWVKIWIIFHSGNWVRKVVKNGTIGENQVVFHDGLAVCKSLFSGIEKGLGQRIDNTIKSSKHRPT